MGPEEVAWFDEQLTERHYLKAGRPVGDDLRQVVRVRGRPAALLAWSPACYALKDRDRRLGGSATPRVERLKLIGQNRRFLLLSARGEAPNLALIRNALFALLPEHFPDSSHPVIHEQLHSRPAACLRVIRSRCAQNKRPCIRKTAHH